MPRLPAPLPRRFYRRPTEQVAPELLGCLLVHDTDRGLLVGRIVETEAYGGPGDVASHAHRSPTGRPRIMFGDPGFAYVYFTYGMHHCMNVVAHVRGAAGAVLLRAAEPIEGVDRMRASGIAASTPDDKLASGPGRLARAFGIGRDHYGADLLDGPLTIRRGPPPAGIERGPRVGLSADDGRDWRFWVPSTATSRGSTGRKAKAAAERRRASKRAPRGP